MCLPAFLSSFGSSLSVARFLKQKGNGALRMNNRTRGERRNLFKCFAAKAYKRRKKAKKRQMKGKSIFFKMIMHGGKVEPTRYAEVSEVYLFLEPCLSPAAGVKYAAKEHQLRQRLLQQSWAQKLIGCEWYGPEGTLTSLRLVLLGIGTGTWEISILEKERPI